MSCNLVVRVLNGRDNTRLLVFGLKSAAGVITAYDWTGVTRFTLEFTDSAGDPVVVDTDLTPDAIVPGTQGELLFDMGDLGLPLGTFTARLFIYSSVYPNGFLLDNGEGFTFALEVS